MTARQRSAGLALVGCLGCMAAGLLSGDADSAWAGPHAAPARTAQFITPEPPLARPGQAAPPPAVTPPPAAPAPVVPAPVPAVPAPPLPALGAPCPPEPITPVVSIHVRVAAAAAAGQELEYRIRVENLARAAAHHVIVRDPLPANTIFVRATPEPSAHEPELLWQLGTLEGCTSREIVLVLQPTGTGDVRNCARVQFEHGQCVCTKITRPAIEVRKTGPTEAVLYDALSYQICVVNTGSSEAHDVKVLDTLPAGLEHSSGKTQLVWELGNLAPGQCRTVEYQLVAKAAGRLCNHTLATAAGGLRAEADHCVTVVEARIELTKTGPEKHYVRLPAAYKIRVSNPGSAALTNVVITDPVPAGTTFFRATTGGQLVGNEVRWSIGTLGPGAERTVEVTLRGLTAGRVCNRATVTADRGLTKEAEACTEFLGTAGLAVDVDDDIDPVEVGGETTYTITAQNQGTARATNVRLTATVPERMRVSRITPATGHRQVGQQILFDPVNLEAGGKVEFRVTVQALQAGDVRFRVEMRADQLTTGPVVAEESTTISTDIAPARPSQPLPAAPGPARP
jgi:uncharacterized repeat protein (TIGR01451 family)